MINTVSAPKDSLTLHMENYTFVAGPAPKCAGTCKRLLPASYLAWNVEGAKFCNECYATKYGQRKYRAVAQVAKVTTGTAVQVASTAPAGSLPFKSTSHMRFSLERALSGTSLTLLRTELEARGTDPDLQLKVLLSGGNCQYCRTHQWNLQRSGDFVKVINVRPVAAVN